MILIWVASSLVILALVLLAAEIVLPLHGTSAIGAAAALLICIGICFARSLFAGLGAVTAISILTPGVFFWFTKIWPRTPVGRRLILPAQSKRVERLLPEIGVRGVTVTQLRPSGICEFAGQRMQVISQAGLIPPATPVRVAANHDARVVVEAV